MIRSTLTSQCKLTKYSLTYWQNIMYARQLILTIFNIICKVHKKQVIKREQKNLRYNRHRLTRFCAFSRRRSKSSQLFSCAKKRLPDFKCE